MLRKSSVVALAFVALAACSSDASRVTGPSLELVDPDKRVDAAAVNAHVYGTFAITFEGTAGVILSGPANFPGNPKGGPGYCVNGLWYNSQGKPTSGDLDRPHPHCVSTGTATMVVVLEPISAVHGNIGQSDGEYLKLAADNEDGRVRITGNGAHSRGEGVIVAYAIDASTLGTTNVRVGTLTFNLNQYDLNNTNYFAVNCTLGDVNAPRCLNKVITADYEPLAGSDGVGEAREVTGYLYWTSASSPFNYD